MHYAFKKRARAIPRYNATRIFLDVYDADGLILYSYPLEDEDRFPWSALLSPDGRFTLLVSRRRVGSFDDHRVFVYETESSARLYELPDPRITFDPSGEFAYRLETATTDPSAGERHKATIVLDALTGETLQRYLDEGALFHSGQAPQGEMLPVEAEPGDWFTDRIAPLDATRLSRRIIPGEGIMTGAPPSEADSFLLHLGQEGRSVREALGSPSRQRVEEDSVVWSYYDLGLLLALQSGEVSYISLFSGAPRPFYYSRFHHFKGATDSGVGIGSMLEEVLAAYGAPEKDIEMHFASMPYRWLDYSATRGIEFSFLPRTGQLFKIDLSRMPGS